MTPFNFFHRILEIVASIIAITAFLLSFSGAIVDRGQTAETELAIALARLVSVNDVFKFIFFLILDTCLSFFFINFLRGQVNRGMKPLGGAPWIFGHLLTMIFIFMNAWTTVFAIEVLFLQGQPLGPLILEASKMLDRQGPNEVFVRFGWPLVVSLITIVISILIATAFAFVEKMTTDQVRLARIRAEVEASGGSVKPSFLVRMLRYSLVYLECLFIFLPVYLILFAIALAAGVSTFSGTF